MENYQATIKVKAEKQYAALRRQVAQPDIPKEIPPLIEVLMDLLRQQDIKTTGECFFRYLSCAGDGLMVIEAGFPIEDTASRPHNIHIGTFPGGQYLSVIHHGDYKNLMHAHAYLEQYAEAHHLPLDQTQTDKGTQWGCRAEIYLTEPDVTPVDQWQTEVIFLLKDKQEQKQE